MVGGRLRLRPVRVVRRPRRDLTDEICGPRQRTSAPEGARRSCLRVRQPRLVALTAGEQREAVALLADLIGAAAAKRRPGVIGGVLDGAYGGAIPGVGDQAARAEKAGSVG